MIKVLIGEHRSPEVASVRPRIVKDLRLKVTEFLQGRQKNCSSKEEYEVLGDLDVDFLYDYTGTNFHIDRREYDVLFEFQIPEKYGIEITEDFYNGLSELVLECFDGLNVRVHLKVSVWQSLRRD